MVQHMLPGLDLYHADPAQPVTTASEEPEDLDHDLSDLSEVCNGWPAAQLRSLSARKMCDQNVLRGSPVAARAAGNTQ